MKICFNMTLDEAIEHCKEVSERCNNHLCAYDHLQLMNWLIELKQRRNSD